MSKAEENFKRGHLRPREKDRYDIAREEKKKKKEVKYLVYPLYKMKLDWMTSALPVLKLCVILDHRDRQKCVQKVD